MPHLNHTLRLRANGLIAVIERHFEFTLLVQYHPIQPARIPAVGVA